MHRHKITKHQIRCRDCNNIFKDNKELYEHRMLTHQIGLGDELQQDPYARYNENPPWMNENGEVIDDELKRTYENHRPVILQPHDETGNIKKVYNFPIDNNLTLNEMDHQIGYIYDRLNNAFKINFSFGVILKNIETGEYRHFKAYDNGQQVFPYPFRVSTLSNLRFF